MRVFGGWRGEVGLEVVIATTLMHVLWYRKKAEQAEAREEIKAARKAGVDVDGGSEHRRTGVEVD